MFLLLVTTANAADMSDDNITILSNGDNIITSDLSNNDIQSKFDNAKDGDTFEFTDEKYQNIF